MSVDEAASLADGVADMALEEPAEEAEGQTAGHSGRKDEEIPLDAPLPSADDGAEKQEEVTAPSQVQERGGQLNGLHRDEDNSDPRWRRRKKHIFIVSSAGKPIFTRHGDEDKLNPLFGVMCSLVSFMTQNDDMPRVVLAGNHKIVFLIRGPIYLISVSRTLEPTAHLARQLQFVYTQLVSILTRKGLEHVFKRKHGFDLRNLLGNSGEQVLSHLVGAMDGHKLASSLPLHTSMSFVLGAPWCARLPLPLRNQVNKALLSVKSQHLIYAVLLAKNQLVQFVRPRKTALWAEGLFASTFPVSSWENGCGLCDSVRLCRCRCNPRGARRRIALSCRAPHSHEQTRRFVFNPISFSKFQLAAAASRAKADLRRLRRNHRKSAFARRALCSSVVHCGYCFGFFATCGGRKSTKRRNSFPATLIVHLGSSPVICDMTHSHVT